MADKNSWSKNNPHILKRLQELSKDLNKSEAGRFMNKIRNGEATPEEIKEWLITEQAYILQAEAMMTKPKKKKSKK
jgi:pyrroloquinoline quinone (PQQ) biosynthesis protein C